MSKLRHSRQVRLAEVGEEGQARLEATTAFVAADGLAGAVEVRYLAGAGVRKISTGDEAIAEAARAVDSTVQILAKKAAILGNGIPPALGVRDPAALDVALGAWRALAHIRRALLREARDGGDANAGGRGRGDDPKSESGKG
jgi:hypothetical protein